VELFGQSFARPDKLWACLVFLVEHSAEDEDLVLVDGRGEAVDAREFERKPCRKELASAHTAVAEEAPRSGDDWTGVGFFNHESSAWAASHASYAAEFEDPKRFSNDGPADGVPGGNRSFGSDDRTCSEFPIDDGPFDPIGDAVRFGASALEPVSVLSVNLGGPLA
jgi:hypothetical protein